MKLIDEAAAFGMDLIRTQDLDPVYTMLVFSGLSQEEKERWCVAYWMFYNAGFASTVCRDKGADFYDSLLAGLSTWGRGRERRHFRGIKAYNAVSWVRDHFADPERFAQWTCEPRLLQDVLERTGRVPLFGPWIGWKLADMGERILGYRVDFREANLKMFTDPMQGAALVLTGDWKSYITKHEVNAVCDAMLERIGHLKAPPGGDRPVNIQEVETVLCKYKSHWKGHYAVGLDTREIGESLEHAGGEVADGLRKILNERCNDRRAK